MLSIQLLTCAIIALLQNYIAIQLKALYSESVQCKIIGLAVEGYKLQGAQSVIWTFLRVISLCVRILWRSWRGTLSSVQETL